MNSILDGAPQRFKTPSRTFDQVGDTVVTAEARETWEHISVALAPVVARLHRKRVSDASEVQP